MAIRHRIQAAAIVIFATLVSTLAAHGELVSNWVLHNGTATLNDAGTSSPSFVLSGGTGTNMLNGGAGVDSYTLAARTVVGSDLDTIIASTGKNSLNFGTFTHSLIVKIGRAHV